MGKATKSLSGASQKKYFRDLLGATEGLSPETASALGGALEREIAAVRVRLPIPDRGNKTEGGRKVKPKSAAKAAAPAGAPADVAAFDPFAFSVVVVVTKEGRDGLIKRLGAIANRDHLLSLAKAQHVAVPDEKAPLDALREAIAEGALQRIANRRAAAS